MHFMDLANCAYPKLDVNLNMGLACDKFIVHICSECIQEALVQSPPATLDDVQETAWKMDVAQAMWRWMYPRSSIRESLTYSLMANQTRRLTMESAPLRGGTSCLPTQ